MNFTSDNGNPLVHGQNAGWPDETICEHLGEGTWRPVRQIRKGK